MLGFNTSDAHRVGLGILYGSGFEVPANLQQIAQEGVDVLQAPAIPEKLS